MPCNQVVRTRLMVHNEALLRLVAQQVAGVWAQDAQKGADGVLEFNGSTPVEVRQKVTGAYADALLASAFASLGFTVLSKNTLPPEVASEIGPGVQWVFINDTGKTVTVGRANDGRLHFEMAGYSGYEAQDAANLLLDSMKAWGIEPTEPLTIKADDERWLEEKLPDMEPE